MTQQRRDLIANRAAARASILHPDAVLTADQAFNERQSRAYDLLAHPSQRDRALRDLGIVLDQRNAHHAAALGRLRSWWQRARRTINVEAT